MLTPYIDVFAWADTHPQAKQFYDESMEKIRLGEKKYWEKKTKQRKKKKDKRN